MFNRYVFTSISFCFIIFEKGTCNDGLLNQDETQIDCGGVCNRKCGKFYTVKIFLYHQAS